MSLLRAHRATTRHKMELEMKRFEFACFLLEGMREGGSSSLNKCFMAIHSDGRTLLLRGLEFWRESCQSLELSRPHFIRLITIGLSLKAR